MHSRGDYGYKVVRAYEPTGNITQEEIDARLEEERQKRKARADRFNADSYKEPTVEELFENALAAKKRYYNKVNGVECTSNLYVNQEEQSKKSEERRKRFASTLDEVPTEELKPVPQEVVPKRHVSFCPRAKVPEQDLCSVTQDDVRRDTICLNGTDNMSTKDVFRFFQPYGPSCVEWIDDSSCIVIFSDELSSFAALNNLSEEVSTETEAMDDIEIMEVKETTEDGEPTEAKNTEAKETTGVTEATETETKDTETTEAMKTSEVAETTENVEDEIEIDIISDTPNTSEFPDKKFLYWRRCTDPSHLNLFLKLALKTDKRDVNVKKRSRYYEKVYGFAPPKQQRPVKRAKTEELPPPAPKEDSPPKPQPVRRRVQLVIGNNPRASIFGALRPIPKPASESSEVPAEGNTEPAEVEEEEEEEIDLGEDIEEIEG
eukprot:TRINITY_DN13458_c0_g1_i1.p1 TRINITY_DN13458_c0_g1~~TRINITY_DN13458_c0_g1_i1.p1  ORF type:complete len:433 (+),score=114.51 TRINITY_DN13458_c0_g1_i1:24-1322(+)